MVEVNANEIAAVRPEHDAAGRALVVLYDERCNLAAAMADAPHLGAGELVKAAIAKGAELDEACEKFRATYYPRHASCFVGLWSVIVASPRRNKVTTVLDLFAEYGLPAEGVAS